MANGTGSITVSAQFIVNGVTTTYDAVANSFTPGDDVLSAPGNATTTPAVIEPGMLVDADAIIIINEDDTSDLYIGWVLDTGHIKTDTRITVGPGQMQVIMGPPSIAMYTEAEAATVAYHYCIIPPAGA